MKGFWLTFLVCIAFVFTSCQMLDMATGKMVKPKEPVNHGMTINEYAAWYNEHAESNPGLLQPPKAIPEAVVAPVLPAIVSSSDFEPTKGAELVKDVADDSGIPGAGTAASVVIGLAAIYQAYRHNSKKNGQILSMVEAIDKEGTDALKELVEKKVGRINASGQLHKVVEKVKKARAAFDLVKELTKKS